MGREPGADFDRWLSGQLRTAIDPRLGPPPRPTEARYRAASRQHGARVRPMRYGVSAAVVAKALAGGAIVALAAGATATTHSANPASWGQYVAEAVEQCRAPDANVGRCVSALAQEHGGQTRNQHGEAGDRANGANPEPGQTNGQPAGGDASRGSGASASSRGQSQGHAGAVGAGASSHDDHGHGKPSPSASPSPHN